MIGGDDYTSRPFNLATQGQRQPGSAFKPFVLAEALDDGHLARLDLGVEEEGHQGPRQPERFVVNNYENAYPGITTLAHATHASDNTVYAQVGIQVGTRRIARLSRRMGIRTPVSTTTR